MAYLLVNSGSDKGSRIDLPESEPAILGRSSERSNVVVNAESVSGRHASITRGEGCYIVKDLGSTNGTRLEGKIISEEKVFRGDNIGFGDLTVILLGDDVPKSPQSIAPTVVEEKPEPTESAPDDVPSGMQISPRTTKAPTVKILPASFKKKSAHGKIWLVIISLSAILAGVLIWKLFFTAEG